MYPLQAQVVLFTHLTVYVTATVHKWAETTKDSQWMTNMLILPVTETIKLSVESGVLFNCRFSDKFNIMCTLKSMSSQ